MDTIQDFILPDHEKKLDDKVCTNGCSGSVEPQNFRNSLGTPFIHADKNEHQTASKVNLEPSAASISFHTLDLLGFMFQHPFSVSYHRQFFMNSCFRCRFIECALKVNVEP